ncbi:MAG TPA: hypothetical protein VF598_08900, partial [Hymenobacter sp.]
TTNPSNFDKARTGLWLSLQKHLFALYAAEKAFLQSTAFAESFPFSAPTVEAHALADYWKHRNELRDLYGDESNQLDGLTKAIRTKGYSEEEKKQLYLLLLGYFDIAVSVFDLLDSHVPAALPPDEELHNTKERFARAKKFARLNVRGLKGII